MFFHPKVIYRTPHEEKKDSIVRYIGNRVLRNNKNFLCAITGQTGSGKSWAGVSIAEIYSKMFDITFDPEVHIIYNLQQLLTLINTQGAERQIKFGSVLVFDEPQIEANARDWQSEVNQLLNQLISTFRNQRLVIFFCTPYLEFIDKQSRILFHGEFNIESFDKDAKITTLKPRFLEFNKQTQDFYRKRLIIKYATDSRKAYSHTYLNTWQIPKASEDLLYVYERKKKEFTTQLNLRLQERMDKMTNKKEKTNVSTAIGDMEKFKDLYVKYDGDYFQIVKEFPVAITTFERYAKFARKSHLLG